MLLDPAPPMACPVQTGAVVIVGNFLSQHGRNRSVCEDLADRLKSTGWQVFTTSNKTGRIARLIDMLHASWSWRNEYQTAQVDLYSGPAFFWALLLGFCLGLLHKPFVLTLHGGNLPTFSRKWPRSVRWLLHRAAAVTAPSGYLADALRPYRQDITILPNAIDLSLYPFQLRTQTTPTIVWLRAFHHIYQPTLAVHTFAKVLATFPAARLIMAGPDKHDGSLDAAQSLANSLGVSQKIEFLAGIAKSEVPALINRAEIFLNTSAVDNHPVTLIEAMACGACVVSTRPGGIPYLVANEVNGLLGHDANSLAENIARIVRHPNLATQLSTSARRSAEEFDWSQILPRWSSLLSRLASPALSNR